jgi:hypothetical protein
MRNGEMVLVGMLTRHNLTQQNMIAVHGFGNKKGRGR